MTSLDARVSKQQLFLLPALNLLRSFVEGGRVYERRMFGCLPLKKFHDREDLKLGILPIKRFRNNPP